MVQLSNNNNSSSVKDLKDKITCKKCFGNGIMEKSEKWSMILDLIDARLF